MFHNQELFEETAERSNWRTGRNLLFLLLLLFVLGWYWLPASAEQGSTPHDRLFYLGVLPALLVGAFRLQWRRVLGNPVLLPSLLFIGYLGATALWARQPTELSLAEVALHTVATAAFLIAASELLEGRALTLFRQVVPAAAAAVAVMALLRLVQGHGYPVDRLSSPLHFEHPNLFAHYLGFAALLAAGEALRSRSRSLRWTWLAVVGLLAVAVLLTRSRAGFAALLLCLTLAVALYWGRRAAAVLALAMVASGALMSTMIDGHVIAFFLRADAGRDFTYQTLIGGLDDRIWMGAGLAAEDDVRFAKGSEVFPGGFTSPHPHSGFVATLYYGGLLGLGLLVVVTVGALIVAARNGRRRGDWDPLVMLLFAMLCLLPDGHRLVSHPHLSSWLMLWLPMGLVASSWRISLPLPAPAELPWAETSSLARFAPPRRVLAAAAVATLAVLLFRLHASGSGLAAALLIASAAFFYLLLTTVLGEAAAAVAALIYLATPMLVLDLPAMQIQWAGLAMVHAAAWLWAEGLRRESPLDLWIAVLPTTLALLLAPLLLLTVLPLLVWLCVRLGRWRLLRRHLGAVALPLAVLAAWHLRGTVPLSQWLGGTELAQPATELSIAGLLSLRSWLEILHGLISRVVGIAGVVPVLIGTLVCLAPPRRGFFLWLVCAVLTVPFAAVDQSAAVSMVAPMAVAAALGILWLGNELAEWWSVLPNRGSQGRRVGMLVVSGLILLTLLARLFWSAPV